MQKVVGSNPISRLSKPAGAGAFGLTPSRRMEAVKIGGGAVRKASRPRLVPAIVGYNGGDVLHRRCTVPCPRRRAVAQRPARRDASAQAPGAAGLLLGPAVVGGLRDGADRARPRAWRAGAAVPDAVAGRCGRAAAGRSSSRPTARHALPIPTAAARTPSAAPIWARTPSLVAASSLLIDYVLTVAVSVVAGSRDHERGSRRWRRTPSRCRSASS